MKYRFDRVLDDPIDMHRWGVLKDLCQDNDNMDLGIVCAVALGHVEDILAGKRQP